MPGTEQLISKMLGDYRVERLLGQSQLGAAYLAIEPERGIRAMVTTFNLPEGLAGREREQFLARFARESAVLTRLAHAHILPIYAFGEQPGYLYLVTAFVKEASLGQTLKQNTRFTPQQTLDVLRQLASALDYAHSQGITHGMLSLANVVVNAQLEVGIAGFGLRTMLEMHGNHQSARPLAHLSSPQGSFLGSPEYISPERVLGLACDTRVDIYALGVMLFTLLSGVQPFRAATPLDIALQRLQQPTPRVHLACPSVPEAFDLVIGRALERDPARRFQSAGELALAFERVIKTQNVAQQVSPSPKSRPSPDEQATMPPSNQFSPDAQMTMPPTINWFDDQVTPSGRWQVAPPLGAASMQALNSAPALLPGSGILASSPYGTDKINASPDSPATSTSPRNFAPSPYGTEKMSATTNSSATSMGPKNFAPSPYATEKPGLPEKVQAPAGAPAPLSKPQGASLSGIDPFAWWSSHASGRKSLPAASPTPARRISLRQTGPGSRPDQQGRRKVIALAITGVAAAGALSIGGLTFAHLTQSVKQSSGLANAPTVAPTAGNTQPTTGAQLTNHAGAHPTSSTKAKPTSNAGAKPTAAPTKAATKAPTHTGTVIGSTTLAANSSKIFTNPADGASSLLIRLANGTFVACERACTHQGVPVDYDPGSKMIICPAHNAVFDPANGFNHVSGPGNGPLPRVTVRANGDGTVTTG